MPWRFGRNLWKKGLSSDPCLTGASSVAISSQSTILDALLASLRRAADYNRDDTAPPAAIVWPDEKREWEKLIARLRGAMPQFLTLGPYDAAHRSGPAIWLRCALAGKVAEVALPAGTVPIIYLPGVSRATLRATEDCPSELKPLAELQYRGVIWSQANAKDWTIGLGEFRHVGEERSEVVQDIGRSRVVLAQPLDLAQGEPQQPFGLDILAPLVGRAPGGGVLAPVFLLRDRRILHAQQERQKNPKANGSVTHAARLCRMRGNRISRVVCPDQESRERQLRFREIVSGKVTELWWLSDRGITTAIRTSCTGQLWPCAPHPRGLRF
jgi:hypothetical protein